MNNPIGDTTIRNIPGISPTSGGQPAPKPSADFGSIIKGAINKVDQVERNANGAIVDLLQGKADVHQTMISLQKADVSMRTLLAVRNKVLEAYREVMRMHF